MGKTVLVDELMVELLKDRAYYEKSGGGVTLSGGEPTFQPEFTDALLQGLKKEKISVALDTCGLTSQHVLGCLLPYTDLVLFDLKLIDDAQHRECTGHSNERILENLLYIRDYIEKQNHPIDLWIRTPLIPGATDSDENLLGIGRYLAEYLNGVVSRWELCAFNNLCRDQYERLGLEWTYANTPLMTADELAHCEQVAKSVSRQLKNVLATGATRVPEMV
jgi:pyruvate formate lyase activating enzyme